MSEIRVLISQLINNGVDPVEAAEVVARAMIAGAMSVQSEKLEKRRAWDRERKRKANSANSTGIHRNPPEKAEPVVSPKPPSDNPPFCPPKGGHLSPLDRLSEEIWAMQPVLAGKRRATRPDTRRALDSAVKRGTPDEIRTACKAFYALPESRKDGGQFAMGAAKLLTAERWRDFLPRPEPPAKPATPEVLAWRLQHFRETGEWRGDWGDRPKEQAA